MIFDIRGRRKRVVQVIYGGLALLMGLGAVLFGIGGSANGGLADFFGFGTGDTSGSSNSEAQAQIDKAEEALQSNPNDERAMLLLVEGHFQAGTSALSTDEAGNRVPTDESITQFTDATEAWSDYLATDPAKPDADTASIVRQAYPYVFGTTPLTDAKPVIDDAFATAQIVVKDQPGALSYLELATYAYLAGDTKAAEAAKKKALAEAPDDTTKDQIDQQLKAAAKQGEQLPAEIKKAEKASTPTQEELQDPLGALGGSSALPGSAAPPGG